MEQLLEEQMKERLLQGERGKSGARGGVAGLKAARSNDHSPSSSGRTSRLLSVINVFGGNKNS